MPGYWIGEDHGALMVWPVERGGWAKRTAYTGGKRQLEEVEPALARGTGWPGGGRGPAPRDASGKPSKTIGLRCTDDEREKWERASGKRAQPFAVWARNTLNSEADRTLEDDGRPRSKGKS
jgi:hypothetical protein